LQATRLPLQEKETGRKFFPPIPHDFGPLFRCLMHHELRGVASIADFAAGADLADPALDGGTGRELVEHRLAAELFCLLMVLPLAL
jgi:hypothetical protein